MERADVAAGLDAVALLEPHVEHSDVWVERVHPCHGLVGSRRLADDLDVPLGFEEIADPSANDLVVVEEEDGDAVDRAGI